MNTRIELDLNSLFDDDDLDFLEDDTKEEKEFSFKLELDTDLDFNFSLDDEILIEDKKEDENFVEFKKKLKENIDNNDIKCYNNTTEDKESKKMSNTGNRKEIKDMLRINTNIIKKAYKVNNLNQKDLAEILEISERSVNRKLNNETDFTAVELLKLIDLLNIDAKELLN